MKQELNRSFSDSLDLGHDLQQLYGWNCCRYVTAIFIGDSTIKLTAEKCEKICFIEIYLVLNNKSMEVIVGKKIPYD